MALVLAGLVAQGQMTSAHLAVALELPEETVRNAAGGGGGRSAGRQRARARGRGAARRTLARRRRFRSSRAANDDRLAQMREVFI